MSSVHDPSLSSMTPAPLPPQRKASLAPNNISGRKGSTAQSSQHGRPAPSHDPEISTKRKRTIFPPIPLVQDDDAKVTSSKRSHSMVEVVSRMRVREKTLLGAELWKGGEPNPDSEDRMSVDPPTPFSVVEDTAPAQERVEFPSQNPASWSTRPRQPLAWEDSAPWDSSRRADDGPVRGGPVGEFRLPGFPLAPGHTKNVERGVADMKSAGTEEPRPHRAVPDGRSMDSRDDDDFDWDEGEEDLARQRKQDRRFGSTGSTYRRACQIVKVQPSPAFLRQEHLSTMDLRDVRLGPADVKPIAIALVRDELLCSLDLSNNDLGPVGVSYVAEMLRENNTLYELNLSATQPRPEGLKALCDTLPHNRSLGVLRLEDNGIEHTESHLLADMIRRVPTLQGLYLGYNRLGYCGGAAIASALAQNSTMHTLDLQWNHIRRDSAVVLIKALETNRCLRTLNLAWNGLGKEGCLALAHALPKNRSLRALDLTCNRVDLMSLSFLLKGLTRNTSLLSLKIGQNPLTTDGAKALIRAVSFAPRLNLTHIDIGGVPVDLEFTQMVARIQQSRVLHVQHEEAVTLATSDRKREHDGNNLDRFDPVMVFFEYMKLDNLRVIDMFQFMDVKKREKLSKGNIRDGLNSLKIPVTEHAIDVIFEKLDINKDGFVELDEMMKMQRDTARQVKLRQIKAKAKNKEDAGLAGLHKALRDIISKRKEDKEPRRDVTQGVTSTKTSGGGRKVTVDGLQLTQARYSVTSSKRRGENEAQQLTSVPDVEL